MIPKNDGDGFFQKLQYVGGKKVGEKVVGGYTETQKYLDTQPVDKRPKNFAFGSRDAFKTDEFCNTIRTEQYRGTLQKESEISRKGKGSSIEEIKRLQEAGRLSQSAPTSSYDLSGTTNDKPEFSYDSQVPQYDIGRNRINQFNAKSHRDSFYNFNTNRERRLGSHRPTSADIGAEAWGVTYKSPAFGGKSEVKNFWDKSHLQIRV